MPALAKQSMGKGNLPTYNMNRTIVFKAMLDYYRDLCRNDPMQGIGEINKYLDRRTFDGAPFYEVSFRVLLAETYKKKDNYVGAKREIELVRRIYNVAEDSKEEGTGTEAWGSLRAVMMQLHDLIKADGAKSATEIIGDDSERPTKGGCIS